MKKLLLLFSLVAYVTADGQDSLKQGKLNDKTVIGNWAFNEPGRPFSFYLHIYPDHKFERTYAKENLSGNWMIKSDSLILFYTYDRERFHRKKAINGVASIRLIPGKREWQMAW